MAVRYNVGWYNPYAPVSMPTTGVAQLSNVAGGAQPLRGLMFPMTPALVVEPQKPTEVQVTAKEEQKVTATSQNSQAKEDDTFSPEERKKLRTLGAAASISAAFAAGVVVCFIVIGSGIIIQVPIDCIAIVISLEFRYFIFASTVPAPICMFIIGLLCLNAKKEFNNGGKALFGLSIFELILLVPFFLFGGIAGVYQACPKCISSDIWIVLLILPIIIVVMAVAFFIILLLILRLITKKAKAKTTPQAAASQPAAQQPATQPTSAPVPAPTPVPAQAAPTPALAPSAVAPAPVPVPAPQPFQPQQPMYNVPAQPGFPYAPGPFQPGLYRPPNYLPPASFAPSPYGRPPFRPPYGYSPYMNASPYRPQRWPRRQY